MSRTAAYHDRPPAVPEPPPVGSRQRRARLADGQPHHRRRGRRTRLVEQPGELEHVGDHAGRCPAGSDPGSWPATARRAPPTASDGPPGRPGTRGPPPDSARAGSTSRPGPGETTSRAGPARPPSRPARPPRRRRTPGRAGRRSRPRSRASSRAGPAAPRGATRAWAVPSRSTRFSASRVPGSDRSSSLALKEQGLDSNRRRTSTRARTSVRGGFMGIGVGLTRPTAGPARRRGRWRVRRCEASARQ